MNRIAIGIVFLVVALIAGGYYAYGHRASTANTPTPLTVLIAKGGLGEVKSLVMRQYGIDKKHGLNVNFVADNPGTIEQNAIQNKIKSGLFTISPLTIPKARAAGVSLSIVAPDVRMAYSVAVRRDSPIQSIADLRGKRVGVLPKITAPYPFITLAFRAANIDLDADVKLSFGSIPDMVTLLQKGEVDAATVAYPTAAALYASGQFRSIADLEDIWEKSEDGLTNPFVVLAVDDVWLASGTNRDTVKRYIAANLETAKLIKDQPEVITDIKNPALHEFLVQNKLDSPGVEDLLLKNMAKFFYTEWGDKEYQALERVLTRAREAGLMPNVSSDFVIKPGTL